MPVFTTTYSDDHQNTDTMLSRIMIAWFILCSCQGNHPSITRETKAINSPYASSNKEDLVENIENFVYFQDSLRQVLLDRRANKGLKSTILEELHLRGLVNQTNKSIKFDLPFDLHSFDCSAPDCYITDISFEIPTITPLKFPRLVSFKLQESGCTTTNSIRKNGVFELKEESTRFIHYHCEATQGSLVLSSGGSSLYYFPNANPNDISEKSIDQLLQDFERNDSFENQIPYQSSIMTTNDYKIFVEKGE